MATHKKMNARQIFGLRDFRDYIEAVEQRNASILQQMKDRDAKGDEEEEEDYSELEGMRKEWKG